jgi:hypothetical protein
VNSGQCFLRATHVLFSPPIGSDGWEFSGQWTAFLFKTAS